MGSRTIPTVDLSSFSTSSSLPARQAAALQLAQACHSNGCVGIVGHGVPHELLEQGFATAKKLFSLPTSQKMLAPHPKGAVPHRGYSAPGMEKAYTKEDLKQDEDHRDALRRIVDFKVRASQAMSKTCRVLTHLRKHMRLVVKKTRSNTIFGFRKMCYLAFVRFQPIFTGNFTRQV